VVITRVIEAILYGYEYRCALRFWLAHQRDVRMMSGDYSFSFNVGQLVETAAIATLFVLGCSRLMQTALSNPF